MKLNRFIALALLVMLTSASCSRLQNSLGAATSSPTLSPVSTTPDDMPTPTTLHPPQSFTEPERFATRDEFHNAVIDYKGSSSTQMYENATEFHTFENLDWYYDFKNPVEDVELAEISAQSTYVSLDYWDYGDDTHGSLLIRTVRQSVVDMDYTEEGYYDMLRTNNGGQDVYIDGQRVIKEEVYWDNDYYDNYYVCNQYHWIEDGYYVFMRVPPWLLELYPEETFFDIEKVEIPKEKVGDILAD